MILLFDRASSSLFVLPEKGQGNPTIWPAANNVDSHSKGPWPEGVYQKGPDGFQEPGEGPDGHFGKYFLEFDVPGRTGMGIHAGRAGVLDGLERVGYEHATMGCIRTTEEAMVEIKRHYKFQGRCKLAVIS